MAFLEFPRTFKGEDFFSENSYSRKNTFSFRFLFFYSFISTHASATAGVPVHMYSVTMVMSVSKICFSYFVSHFITFVGPSWWDIFALSKRFLWQFITAPFQKMGPILWKIYCFFYCYLWISTNHQSSIKRSGVSYFWCDERIYLISEMGRQIRWPVRSESDDVDGEKSKFDKRVKYLRRCCPWIHCLVSTLDKADVTT